LSHREKKQTIEKNRSLPACGYGFGKRMGFDFFLGKIAA
jgi:hypothetical protein